MTAPEPALQLTGPTPLSDLTKEELIARVGSAEAKWLDEQRTNMELAAEYEELSAENAALKKDVTHWKANHTTEVRRARMLKERPDMPITRVKAYDQWGKDLRLLCSTAAEVAAMQRERIALEEETLKYRNELTRLKQHHYNPFEPDNQCDTYKRICHVLGEKL